MTNTQELLRYIPPDDYDTWLKVGAALKHEGETLETYKQWSAQSSKYKEGDCDRKWDSFKEGTAQIVTGGTIYHLACENGYEPPKDEALSLTDLWLDDFKGVVDKAFVSKETLPPMDKKYDPKGDMLEYLTELFEPEDYVGICTRFFMDKDSKWKPEGKGQHRTAQDIIDKLRKGSVERALGTLNERSGVYVRFNPLDGNGENNSNITRRTYCLIESDTDSIEQQYSLFKAMNLPIKFLIHSGGKSLHAIVHVDAENAPEYRQRVNRLYKFCKDSGLTPDEQDKNESRYSRLPGVKRDGKWQYIIERNLGAKNYKEWEEWVEEQKDDLPSDTSLAEVWNNMPPLKDELIPGVLRVGHKLLLAGPSKAGKSFLLINLCISIAEGIEWLGMPCKQGRVLYVNLELDKDSCFHRFKEIYNKLGITPKHLDCLQIWNLRGHAVPMNKLAPLLIHRFKEMHYEAVVIDPIYKVITGDENNATEMSVFCSYFDKVAAEMEVSVIYCHHHSKGAVGKYSNAADRSSGSGVFARDPDAILDLSQIRTDGAEEKYKKLHPDACEELTAWELSGTLREFPPIPQKRLWFDYPVHVVDAENYLASSGYSETKGKGKNDDLMELVGNALDMRQDDDTAVSLKDVGLENDVNPAKRFGKNTQFMVATLADGTKVVTERGCASLIYEGSEYLNPGGKGKRWFKA